MASPVAIISVNQNLPQASIASTNNTKTDDKIVVAVKGRIFHVRLNKRFEDGKLHNLKFNADTVQAGHPLYDQAVKVVNTLIEAQNKQGVTGLIKSNFSFSNSQNHALTVGGFNASGKENKEVRTALHDLRRATVDSDNNLKSRDVEKDEAAPNTQNSSVGSSSSSTSSTSSTQQGSPSDGITQGQARKGYELWNGLTEPGYVWSTTLLPDTAARLERTTQQLQMDDVLTLLHHNKDSLRASSNMTCNIADLIDAGSNPTNNNLVRAINAGWAADKPRLNIIIRNEGHYVSLNVIRKPNGGVSVFYVDSLQSAGLNTIGLNKVQLQEILNNINPPGGKLTANAANIPIHVIPTGHQQRDGINCGAYQYKYTQVIDQFIQDNKTVNFEDGDLIAHLKGQDIDITTERQAMAASLNAQP